MVLANQSDALAQKLAQKVSRVVVFGLEVLVRVFENGFDVFGAREHHFRVHAGPETVHGAKLGFPAL